MTHAERHAAVGLDHRQLCDDLAPWIRCSASAIGASGLIVARSAKRVMMSVTRATGQSSRASRLTS